MAMTGRFARFRTEWLRFGGGLFEAMLCLGEQLLFC